MVVGLKYLQHLSAQLIHYIPLYIYSVLPYEVASGSVIMQIKSMNN